MTKPSALQLPHVTISAAEIRLIRQRLRWTQARLALRLGVHNTTVCRWENGDRQPSDVHARQLAALAVDVERSPPSILPSTTEASAPAERESERRAILARLNGRHIVASISGGKDSAAMSLYLRELGIEHDRVFLDTGWESPLTYEYLRGELERVLGPITWLRGPRLMEDLVRHKGMFPGRRIRFCTQELKVFPIIRHLRWLMDTAVDVVNAVGIRAAESVARAQLPEWEWQEGFDCEVWRPLLRWSEEDVIAIHRRHGLRPNPLYLLGANRVGCWPCIYARKSEIRLVAETDPARIVRLRVLEGEVAEGARLRAERDGRELTNPPTWFQNPTSRPGPDGRRDGTCWPIDRVVEWSRSAPRGPVLSQDEFLFSAQIDGCMRWGLCETGAASVLPEQTD